MAHRLYRPHVVGPDDDITTPDVVLDRCALREGDGRQQVAVHRLVQSMELQVAAQVDIAPAFAVIGCGGGPLLSLAAIVRTKGQPAATADILLSRAAWRLRNVVPQFDTLQLQLRTGSGAKTRTLASLPQPESFAGTAASDEPAVARGIIEIYAHPDLTMAVASPGSIELALSDPAHDRKLNHTVLLERLGSDRWPERPLPRYTVGPTGDVKHYI